MLTSPKAAFYPTVLSGNIKVIISIPRSFFFFITAHKVSLKFITQFPRAICMKICLFENYVNLQDNCEPYPVFL